MEIVSFLVIRHKKLDEIPFLSIAVVSKIWN